MDTGIRRYDGSRGAVLVLFQQKNTTGGWCLVLTGYGFYLVFCGIIPAKAEHVFDKSYKVTFVIPAQAPSSPRSSSPRRRGSTAAQQMRPKAAPRPAAQWIPAFAGMTNPLDSFMFRHNKKTPPVGGVWF